MIPGFEANLVGMQEGDERTFTVTFPEDYAEESLQGAEVEFSAKLLELRERKLPEADDDFAGLVGEYDSMDALRADLRERMRINALDRARHEFVDRIIEYANGNATVALPQVLVDREVGVMIDELKVRTAEQGIAFEDYLRVTEKDEAALREEYQQGAEQRVKTLLVLGAIADKEEVTVSDEAIQAEIDRVAADPEAGDNIKEYLASDRGRNYIYSQLRRSQTVELLADRWIEGHPEFENVQHQHGHTHDDEPLEDEAPFDPVSEVVEEVTEVGAESEGESKA
jgi:trigger factor